MTKHLIPDETHAHKNRKRRLPSIDELRERYSYDPHTGIITGRRGNPITGTTNKGYLIVETTGPDGPVNITAHRLAFALTYGRWPHLIDHIDHDKTNNRIENLIETTHSANCYNRAKPAFGIWRHKGAWRVNANTKGYHFARWCDALKFRIATRDAALNHEPPPKRPKRRKKVPHPKAGCKVRRPLAAAGEIAAETHEQALWKQLTLIAKEPDE